MYVPNFLELLGKLGLYSSYGKPAVPGSRLVNLHCTPFASIFLG